MHFDLRQSYAWQLLPFWLHFSLFHGRACTKPRGQPRGPAKRSGCSVAVRQHNLDSIQHLLATPTAEKALKSAKNGHAAGKNRGLNP